MPGTGLSASLAAEMMPKISNINGRRPAILKIDPNEGTIVATIVVTILNAMAKIKIPSACERW